VNGWQAEEARVVMRVHTVEDHFTRRLVIPDVELSHWPSR
jgi:hypothetical protein